MTSSVITEGMVTTLKARELSNLLSGQDVDLVDVRDEPEFLAGHIPGARNVPLDALRADPDRALNIPGLRWNRTVGHQGGSNSYSWSFLVTGWSQLSQILPAPGPTNIFRGRSCGSRPAATLA